MQKTTSRDFLSMMSAITFYKAFNAVLVWMSFHCSRFFAKPVVWGKPFSVSIEPTTACNLSCPECVSGLKAFTRPTGTASQTFFQEAVDGMARELIYLNLYFQGEPYLNKDLFGMVAYASGKGIYTSTSTNAHFLDDERARKTVESGLARLIISIDGTDQLTYAQYRKGGELDKVIAGTRNLIRWKKALNSSSPMVVFQFLVVRHNQGQVDGIRELARELGVDKVWLKSAQINDYAQDPHQLIPTIARYSRYKRGDQGQMIPVNPMHNQCWKMWHSNVVTWDGRVVPCCFDKDAQHVMGNLKEQPMQEIWESKNYIQFRQELLKSRKNIDICSNCSEGMNVWR
jgi:radical SAM protein with 4Fe4S-binding SPASM domain